jgi:hypothetical protein
MTSSTAPVVRTEAANCNERIAQCQHIQAQVIRHRGLSAGSPARSFGFLNDPRPHGAPAAADSRLGLQARRPSGAPLNPVPIRRGTVAAES